MVLVVGDKNIMIHEKKNEYKGEERKREHFHLTLGKISFWKNKEGQKFIFWKKKIVLMLPYKVSISVAKQVS